tara:strand:+ start:545 stop:712 length:168 start_codon:yes stop_codon:yes gene_type:complete
MFDPSQETFEEYLRRISIGPCSRGRDVLYMDHGHKETDKAVSTGQKKSSAKFSED